MDLYAFGSDWEPAPRPIPSGKTLLAIGDVHGCSAQLDGLLTLLEPTIAAAEDCELVMVGDYVDRGPDSLGVLQRIAGLKDRLGIPVHTLRGNHDQFLIDFLHDSPDPDLLDLWVMNGGDATLNRLGIGGDEIRPEESRSLSAHVRERLGEDLIALLDGLDPYAEIGPYLFVHAGIHPDRPLAEQGPEEFLWLREPFLGARRWDHPFAVVHGHTILGPQVLPHRVGLDSGCFATGVLTAVEIAGDRLRFRCVASEAEPTAFRGLLDPVQVRAFSEPQPLTMVEGA